MTPSPPPTHSRPLPRGDAERLCDGATSPQPADRRAGAGGLAALAFAVLVVLAIATRSEQPAHAQACPPYCETPVITPAWHLHMCDEPYQEQLDDNHCMNGPGMTEFPAGTDRVYAIYCHSYSDTVVVQIKDSGGGLQHVNHPDGITYDGQGCETITFAKSGGIPPEGSPYQTSAYWPEGPFSGVGAGIEWYIGLFVAFDADVYYGPDAEAVITARDPAADSDPTALDRITVHVTSTSDPVGIDVDLVQERPGASIYRSARGVRFSAVESDPAAGVIKVNNRDQIKVVYCPRDCQTPYVDTATWYQLEATITPTPLPTWSGPPPTATPTPPPNLRVEYLTLRPAPDDVGYVPQISANKDRVNHLGYPTIYGGMWTHGRNLHHGMIQLDLAPLPEGATVIDARLELVGREARFLDPGTWSVHVLADAIDAGWRSATFDQVHDAPTVAQVGDTLSHRDLAVGRTNSFGFGSAALAELNARIAGTGRLSLRVDGPAGEENNVFGWHSGVDVYEREPEPPDPALGPALYLAYTLPGLPDPTATGGPGPDPSPSAAATEPTAAGPTATDSAPPDPTPSVSPSASPSATVRPPDGTPSLTPGLPTTSATPGPTSPSGSTATPGAGATASASATSSGAAPSATAPSPTWPPDGTATSHVPPDPTSGPGGSPTVGPGTGTPTTPGSGATASATAPTAEVPSETPATVPPTAPSGSATAPPGGTAAPTVGPTPTPTATGPATQRMVCVLAFDDRDASGARAPSEDLLVGVTFRLTHQGSGAFLTWTTDAANDPDFCWHPLTDGQYTLEVVELPRGYVAVGPDDWQFEVPFPGPPARYALAARRADLPTPTSSATPTATATATPPPTPTATPQPTVVGPRGEVCVTVFHDGDGDGAPDPDERRLDGLTIEIDDSAHVVVRELRSRSDRPVCSILPVGVYYVRAALAPGMARSTADEVPVLLVDGAEAVVDFGQRPLRRGGAAYLPYLSLRGRELPTR